MSTLAFLSTVLWKVVVPVCLVLAGASSVRENSVEAYHGLQETTNYLRGTQSDDKDKDEETKRNGFGRQ